MAEEHEEQTELRLLAMLAATAEAEPVQSLQTSQEVRPFVYKQLYSVSEPADSRAVKMQTFRMCECKIHFPFSV